MNETDYVAVLDVMLGRITEPEKYLVISFGYVKRPKLGLTKKKRYSESGCRGMDLWFFNIKSPVSYTHLTLPTTPYV